MSELIQGSLQVAWSIDEAELGLAGSDDLTSEQLTELYDDLETVLIRALPTAVEVYHNGRAEPPVTVKFKVASPEQDIDIDDGPVNGTLLALRDELPS